MSLGNTVSGKHDPYDPEGKVKDPDKAGRVAQSIRDIMAGVTFGPVGGIFPTGGQDHRRGKDAIR